jgi:hypothetical protein
MNYFLKFYTGSKEQLVSVEPSHIRDAHVGETVMLETFVPESFKNKTFAKIASITVEKGKRIYELTVDYRKGLE